MCILLFCKKNARIFMMGTNVGVGDTCSFESCEFIFHFTYMVKTLFCLEFFEHASSRNYISVIFVCVGIFPHGTWCLLIMHSPSIDPTIIFEI